MHGMEDWLAASPWYGMILWIILYISDYYLTIYSARGFREIGHFQFEGSFELTPRFQKDVNALKPISNLHLLALVVTSLLILAVWWLTNSLLSFPWTYRVYLLYLGMFLLLEVAVHFRHLRNVALIREIKRGGGVEGEIFYRKWFSYRISASEFYRFAIFFLIIAAIYFSSFFLGGALMCFSTGIRHDQWAKKAKSHSSQVAQVQP
jgi:hypothetical protein